MAELTLHRTGPRAGRSARRGAWSELMDEFRRDMNVHFDPRSARSVQTRGVYPPVNFYETEDAYVLTAELPGVAPEEIDVSLEGSTVTISGQRKVEYPAGDGTAVHRRERQSGNFRRAFELPKPFDVGQAVARHHEGVLELRVPKTPEAKPRQIEVQTS